MASTGPRASRTPKATEESTPDLVEELNATPLPTKVVESSDPNTGEWFEGFDLEEFPDMVVVGEGEQLIFQVLSSNMVPLENRRTGDVEDVEVCQVLVLAGSTATEKIEVGDGKNKSWESTHEQVPVGETRSFWVNSALLKKAWAEWEVRDDDEGAVKYVGHVESRRGNEYQKWFVKFKKDKPRRSLAR